MIYRMRVGLLSARKLGLVDQIHVWTFFIAAAVLSLPCLLSIKDQATVSSIPIIVIVDFTHQCGRRFCAGRRWTAALASSGSSHCFTRRATMRE